MIDLVKKIFWYVLVPLGLIYLVLLKGPDIFDKAKKSEADKTRNLEQEADRKANQTVNRGGGFTDPSDLIDTGTPMKVDTQKPKRIADEYNEKVGEKMREEE